MAADHDASLRVFLLSDFLFLLLFVATTITTGNMAEKPSADTAMEVGAQTNLANTTHHSTDTENIRDQDHELEKGALSSSDMQNITSTDVVDWDGEDDPTLPMNWTNMRKFKNISVICYCTFLT